MVVIPRLTGEQIVALRKSRNLTQTEFGKIFDVSRRAVAAWESDTWRAPADLLARFTDSAIGNAKTAKPDMIAVGVYRDLRNPPNNCSHGYIIDFWQSRGFVPSRETQLAIAEAFPDILNTNPEK